MSITKTESQVLFRKYINGGLSPYEASRRVESIRDYLRKMVLRMQRSNKSPEYIDSKFRQEFEKICQKIEGEFG